MNWKKIDENWKSFVRDYNLREDSDEVNYFHGKQELYKASEDFHGFVIYYENKFNKSSNFGSSFPIGNRLTIVSPIEMRKKLRLTVQKTTLWKRLLNSNEQLKIEISDNQKNNFLPIDEIAVVTEFFPDLKVTIKEFDKYQNQQIPFGQIVLMIETKYQPEELEHLQKSRGVITSILQKLAESKKIKPVHNKT